MYVLSQDKLVILMNGIVEGQSLRSLERMTGVHRSLKLTPALAAGITDHLWTMDEFVEPAYNAFRAQEAN